MSKVCGETLSACLFEVGKIAIYHTIPTPKHFRYKYQGRSWQTVKNDEESLDPDTEVTLGGQQNIRYNVYMEADFTLLPVTDPPSGLPPITTTGKYLYTNLLGSLSYLLGGYSIPESDILVVSSFAIALTLQNWNNGNNIRYPYELNPDIRNNTNEGTFEQPGYGSGYFTVRVTNITLANGDPDPDTHCDIYSVNPSGVRTLRDSGSPCPQIEIIPCQYESHKEKKQDGNIWFPLTAIQVINLAEEDNKLCTLVQASIGNVSPPNPNNPISWNGSPITEFLGKFCSPIGCEIYPKVCIDCDPKECPEGTCGVEDCSGNICCYNCDGKLVEVIKK